MRAALSEAVVEDAALAWLETLGWTTAHGPDIAPNVVAEAGVGKVRVCGVYGKRRVVSLLIGGVRMANWEQCSAVEREHSKLNGAWVFRGTRVPVSALFENLKDGATVEQFLEWFPGVEDWTVEAVLAHEVKSLVDAEVS